MRSVEEILRIFKENKISGYQLGKDIEGVTQVGADKFLNGETKKPIERTLKLYNSYINNNFKPLVTYQLTEEKKLKLNENQASYKVLDNFKNLPIDDKLNAIYELLKQNAISLELLKRNTEIQNLDTAIKNIETQKKPESKK